MKEFKNSEFEGSFNTIKLGLIPILAGTLVSFNIAPANANQSHPRNGVPADSVWQDPSTVPDGGFKVHPGVNGNGLSVPALKIPPSQQKLREIQLGGNRNPQVRTLERFSLPEKRTPVERLQSIPFDMSTLRNTRPARYNRVKQPRRSKELKAIPETGYKVNEDDSVTLNSFSETN